MPVKGKGELIAQSVKFAHEFRADFLLSTVDTVHFLVGLDYLTTNDSKLYAKKKSLPWEYMPKVTIESKTKYQLLNVLDISLNTRSSS